MMLCFSGRNLDSCGVSELHALGLVVENEDPLPENLQNVGTMNYAADAEGNWIILTICPCTQEDCCNVNGECSLMSCKIVAKTD